MKKSTFVAAAAAVGLAGVSQAAVTLTFGDSGFLGEGGQYAGITWGIVVDTGSDGFDVGTWEGVSLTNASLFTASDDDQFFLGDSTTQALAGGVVPGVIGNATGLPGSIAGLPFGVIWFDSTLAAGDDAGFGNTFGFSGLVGNTPPDSGTLGYKARGGSATTAFAGVPEPSITLLGALGFLGLIRRRR